MGANLAYKDNLDIWVSDGTCDFICEIIVEVARLEGRDISAAFDEALGGLYRCGCGTNLDLFLPYFENNEQAFLQHLKTCRKRIHEVCDSERVASNMVHVLHWVEYVVTGGSVVGSPDFYSVKPPLRS